MNKLQKIIYENKKVIGLWGYPDPEIFLQIKNKYPQYEIIDLDINYESSNSGIIPDAYCRIIHNIINNAIVLKNNLEVIIAAVGEEKCDSGRFAAKILEDMSFNVIQTKFNDSNDKFETPISTSNLPLKQKIITIMDNLIEKSDFEIIKIKPEYGFWGVAPNDLSILEYFPDSHMFTAGQEQLKRADHLTLI